MLAEIVLVTRLLGLISAHHDIEVQADPSVHAVEIVLDGKVTDVLREPRWRTKLDLGSELAPHEVIAIARDADGREMARDIQFVNVPRPYAEIGVIFHRDRAHITWRHIGEKKPKKMLVKLGDKTLASKVTDSVPLPPLAPSSINVLTIDVTFEDGTTAHREVVFGGVFAEEMPAELTATAVRERAEGRKDKASCFRSEGQPVVASEVEDPEALIVFVRHPDAPALQYHHQNTRIVPEKRFMVQRTAVRFVWPVARRIETTGTELFSSSKPLSAGRGLRALLTMTIGPHASEVRLTDALTIAATEAVREPRRRAVVLVLNGEKDQSLYDPDTVRRYMERLGVPLYVWSLKGPVEESSWGEVTDVSKFAGLEGAVRRVEQDLLRQRIAWLPLNPYDALHVSAAADCAWEPLARP